MQLLMELLGDVHEVLLDIDSVHFLEPRSELHRLGIDVVPHIDGALRRRLRRAQVTVHGRNSLAPGIVISPIAVTYGDPMLPQATSRASAKRTGPLVDQTICALC
jgi:hypothetical protein